MKIINGCNLTWLGPGFVPLVFLLVLLVFLSISPALCSERPAVRVTTGMVEIDGWQSDLVEHNPNISRWHWNPMYAYQQGVVRGGQKQGAPPGAKSGANYEAHKPVDHAHYLKPVQVPFNPKAQATVARRVPAWDKRISGAVSGRVQTICPVKEASGLLKPGEKKVLQEASYATYDKAVACSQGIVHGQLKKSSCQSPLEQLRALPKKLGESDQR